LAEPVEANRFAYMLPSTGSGSFFALRQPYHSGWAYRLHSILLGKPISVPSCCLRRAQAALL